MLNPCDMMDSHENKTNYSVNSNKGTEVYDEYVRTQCAQQSQSQSQHFLPPYAYNMPQQLIYNQNQSMYNIMYGSQSIYRNQNTLNSFPQSVETIPWASESCVNSDPLKDRKESNCCTENMTCVYKTMNKGFYYNKNGITDSWFYNTNNYDNQKYSELPSCSRIKENMNECCSLDNKNIKSVKYCSIQKYSEEFPNFLQSNISQPCNIYNDSQMNATNSCNTDHFYPSTHETNLHFDVPKIDDKVVEESNAGGESDIVVEDTEEESEESDIEKEERECFLCHVSIVDSYVITADAPVSSYSQTPVSQLINNVIGVSEHLGNNLCNTCMNLINTLDNFQVQLNTVRQEVILKYKMSLETFKTVFNTNSCKPLQKKRKFKAKDVCGTHSFKCTVCEKIFSLKKFYLFHMAKHKIKTKYLCEHCGCTFVKNSNLVAHLRKHSLNNIEIKTFMCHICGKIFKSKSNLTNHENVCSGTLPFSCNLCDKKYPSVTKLKQHTQLKHEQLFKISCPKCSKGFVKKSDLKVHLITHSSVKKFQCIKCNKSYKTVTNLNQHLKSHEEKLPFTCTMCSKGFIRKESLESHLNLHNGVKPFVCSVCNKNFACKKFLDAHLKIHNGTAKVQMCPICGKQIKHGLKDHLRTHNNVKEIICNVCDMKFLTKSALAKHKKRKHDHDIVIS